jgi:murein DD-endopeptidase MepM/ murein hydrolase activator NlpD
MNIIFVSNKMAKAKSLAVWQVGLIVLALTCLPVLLTLMLILPQTSSDQQAEKLSFPAKLRLSFNNPQKHLDAYAVMMGEMQARIMRLDAQTERLLKLAGEKKEVIENAVDTKAQKPNMGGPLVLTAPKSELELQKSIDQLMAEIEFKTDYLDTLEAKLLQQSVYKDMLPNSSPVNAAYNSSSYGWRVDPFNRSRAFHEGLDFTANTGTLIYAAGDGVVSFAERSGGYGNMVKVDHGSGLETRYAHAAKLLVKVGQRITKGQVVAQVGSTGRSTGPHLHYEIRLNGVALDPRKYLKKNSE